LRKLVVLPVAFALAMALVVPTAALAAEEGLSGYSNKPTTSSTTPTPATGTSPSKESSTPTKTTAPETSSTEPSTTSEPTAKKASTLPFTGFDLRWTIGAGVILLAMGFSIVTVQRRQRRNEH
jgi:septal ring-binding cell division protein DamX